MASPYPISPNGIDAALSSFGAREIHKSARAVRRLRPRERDALFRRVASSLRGPRFVTDTDRRLAAVRFLVAGLPASLPHIRTLLARRRSVWNYEVHFSLFCWLDEVQSQHRFPASSKKLDRDALFLVEEYLLVVPRRTAYAAWMAGDLLGDHWRQPDGAVILLRTLRHARFAAGRSGVIHGLVHASANLPPSWAAKIEKALMEVAKHDRSESVRRDAIEALEGRGCASLNLKKRKQAGGRRIPKRATRRLRVR
jgi:hypothetical protein